VPVSRERFCPAGTRHEPVPNFGHSGERWLAVTANEQRRHAGLSRLGPDAAHNSAHFTGPDPFHLAKLLGLLSSATA
jgi:hypothetical protein